MSFLNNFVPSFSRRNQVAAAQTQEAATARRILRRQASLRHRLTSHHAKLRALIARAERRRDTDKLRHYCWQLADVLEHIRIVEWIGGTRERSSAGAVPLVVSSWLLRDSFQVCTETEAEGMHFLAGYNLDGVTIATRIIRCAYAARSWASAMSDQVSTQRALIASHDRGHRLVAILHAHPGSGREANHPSSVDRHTHRLFEQTSRIVGGIWSRDGWLRWFSASHPFRIVVAGSDVEKRDEHLFRLKMESPPLEV